MDPCEPDEIGVWKRGPLVGSGGFGNVTVWRNEATGQVIAVKKCRWGVDRLMSPKQRERWQREVDILLRLSNPNVITCFRTPPGLDALSSSADSTLPILCMEYCSAGDLRQLLKRPENCCGLEEKLIRRLLHDVTSATRYLHSKRIIHRDLKPENIVLQREVEVQSTDSDGSTTRPATSRITFKLIDLGYAKEMDANSNCSSFVGTFQYVAPELFTSREYSCTVDYWSLGLVVHECLTGFRPFLPDSNVARRFAVLEGKTRDEICVCIDLDGNLERSCTLAPEVLVSKPFAIMMEKWLKILLEWNPSIRGRLVKDGPVVIYSQLEELLRRKIVSFFCLDTCRMLSYDVEPGVSMSELQLWMETDAQIAAKDQFLIGWNGRSLVSPSDLSSSSSSTSPSSPSESSKCVGVLIGPACLREDVWIPRPEVPSAVERMLKEPGRRWNYYKMKRIFAAGVYFLRKQCVVLNFMFKSKAAFLRHLKCLEVDLNDLSAVVNSKLDALGAVLSVFNQSLELDLCHGQKLHESSVPGLSRDVLSLWTGSGDGAKVQFGLVSEQARQVSRKCGLISEAIDAFDSVVDPVNSSADALNKHYVDALDLYKTLLDRPKEERGREEDAGKMVSLVYNCLKRRDKIYRDFFSSMRKVDELRLEAVLVGDECRAVLSNVELLTAEVASCQLQRQADVWASFSSLANRLSLLPPDSAGRVTSPAIAHHSLSFSRTCEKRGESAGDDLDSNANDDDDDDDEERKKAASIPAAVVRDVIAETDRLIEENTTLRIRLNDATAAVFAEQKRLMSVLPAKSRCEREETGKDES